MVANPQHGVELTHVSWVSAHQRKLLKMPAAFSVILSGLLTQFSNGKVAMMFLVATTTFAIIVTAASQPET
jgi:hypothetical protein